MSSSTPVAFPEHGSVFSNRMPEEIPYVARDITAVVCVRAHGGNPWVMERLERLRGYYEPAPRVLLVDFGSAAEHAVGLRERCGAGGFDYVRMEDDGIFSLSAARNRGAVESETELLYFTDIDFFGPRDLFGKLAAYATDHQFREVKDVFLCLPAYHLGREASEHLWDLPVERWGSCLERTAVSCVEAAAGAVAEFVVPYSNNFLCTRDFFMMTGGYDTRFRGHGSEDFELMIRVAMHNRHFELPKDLEKDQYGPKSEWFFRQRPYAGFRRLGEAMGYRAESAGFKVFHLWHPLPAGDPWRDNKDKGRGRLNSVLEDYLGRPDRLADLDHLEQPESAVCVCDEEHRFAWFLPLRALGYRVRRANDGGVWEEGTSCVLIAGTSEKARRLAAEAEKRGVEVISAARDGDAVVYLSGLPDGGKEGTVIGKGRIGTMPGGVKDFRGCPVVELEWKGRTVRFSRIASQGTVNGASYLNARLGLGMDTGAHFAGSRPGWLKRTRKSVKRWLRGK